MTLIQKKSYTSIPINKREILRYAGMNGQAESDLLNECLTLVQDVCVFDVCYTIFPFSAEGDQLHLGFVDCHSSDLAKTLKECSQIILFAATIGSMFDRVIEKYKRLSPSRALMLQAIGAERVESLCDRFYEDMRHEYTSLRPRFSPGYGDLPLSLQKEIFRVLDCPRRIGVSLNESLLMSPSKSVTAIIGIN